MVCTIDGNRQVAKEARGGSALYPGRWSGRNSNDTIDTRIDQGGLDGQAWASAASSMSTSGT